jgi:hypothetical protein
MKKIAITLLMFLFTLTLMAQTQDSIIVPSHESVIVKVQEKTNPDKKRSYFGIALGVSASTNGFGVSVNTALNKRFALRLGYETMNMSFKNAFVYTQDNYSFNVTPTWQAGGLSAILDFYLFRSLYLSGGLVYTNFNLTANIKSDHSIKIGDIEFQPNEMGELDLTVKPLARLAPYVAIGLGRNISRDHRLCMSFEMGAYFMKSYVVGLTGTQLFDANGQPENQESLNNLNETLRNSSWSGLYPVIKLGISYKIFEETKK